MLVPSGLELRASSGLGGLDKSAWCLRGSLRVTDCHCLHVAQPSCSVPPQVWRYRPHLWRAQQDQKRKGVHVLVDKPEGLWLPSLEEQC